MQRDRLPTALALVSKPRRVLQGPWLPKHHYSPLHLRCVLPSCSETGEVGLAFDVPNGSVVRLRISRIDAQLLRDALAEDQRLVVEPQEGGSHAA